MLKKLMIGRMIIVLCLLPLAGTAYAQRAGRHGPRQPQPPLRGRHWPKLPGGVHGIRPPARPAGIPTPKLPAPPLSLPESPEPPAMVMPVPVYVPPVPQPRDWREFSSQVSASPLGGMTAVLGNGLGKAWGFLKDHAPDMTGALSHLGDMAASGAAMLPSLADVTGSVSKAAQSVADLAASALPSLTNVTGSVSGAADSISRIAGLISGIIAAIGGFIDKAKWFLIVLLGMVLALLLARVIRLGLTVAQIIARVIGFLGFLTRRAQPQSNRRMEPQLLSVRCPGCRKDANIPAGWAGKRVRCKHCEARFSAVGS